MQQLLEDNKEKLSLLQSHIDFLYRKGECGDLLQCQVSKLKMSYNNFMVHHRDSHQLLAEWVSNTIVLYHECEAMYQGIYISFYTASNNSHQTVLKPSAVPIDPESALNIIDYDESIRITLHNDNETLMKFPQTYLQNIKTVDSLSKDIDNYYEMKCLIIDGHVERYREICNTIENNTIIMKDINLYLSQIGSGLLNEEFSRNLYSINNLQNEEKLNCLSHLDNLMAKMLVVSQLKDRLFRAYNLTKTQKISTVKSVL